METKAEIIKQKVDEAGKETWDLIAKKALEAGVTNESDGLWLFYSRVNALQFAWLNAPRIREIK